MEWAISEMGLSSWGVLASYAVLFIFCLYCVTD